MHLFLKRQNVAIRKRYVALITTKIPSHRIIRTYHVGETHYLLDSVEQVDKAIEMLKQYRDVLMRQGEA